LIVFWCFHNLYAQRAIRMTCHWNSCCFNRDYGHISVTM
jgi:hypothetical protein